MALNERLAVFLGIRKKWPEQPPVAPVDPITDFGHSVPKRWLDMIDSRCDSKLRARVRERMLAMVGDEDLTNFDVAACKSPTFPLSIPAHIALSPRAMLIALPGSESVQSYPLRQCPPVIDRGPDTAALIPWVEQGRHSVAVKDTFANAYMKKHKKAVEWAALPSCPTCACCVKEHQNPKY